MVSFNVFDGQHNDLDDVWVKVALPPNDSPVAEAGNDLSVVLGDTFGLDGSNSSDPDGDTLTYSWAVTGLPSGASATLSTATMRW